MKRVLFFSIFLIIFISLILPFPIEAQESSYWVECSIVGRNVVFPGENVSLGIDSNCSTVNLTIYAPDNSLFYNETVNSNFTYVFGGFNVYGLYTVRATVENCTSETWFWLPNLDGMSVAPPETVWVWNGITCNLSTVVEAGKIATYLLTANFEGKSLTFDWLSEVFTKLKPTEVKVESNGECWHVKTYSAKNKIDSWIMNTYFGVKIRVNGTLEKETTFKWNFKNVYGNILWQLDNIRLPADSANLIFDYSDLTSRSLGCTYAVDKTNMKLDVYLQPNFDIDPTIFSDGFESGDFSAWTGTYADSSGLNEVITAASHHGNYGYHSKITSGDGHHCYIYKDISPQALLYVRVYAKLIQTNYRSDFLRVEYHSEDWKMFTVGVTSDRYLRIYGYDVDIFEKVSSTQLTTGQWYSIELKWEKGTNKVCRVYLDGSEVSDLATTTNYANNFDRVRLGAGVTIPEYGTMEWYFDCVVVADTYIGPETAAAWHNVEQWMLTLRNPAWFTAENWMLSTHTLKWFTIEQWLLTVRNPIWNFAEQWILTLKNYSWFPVETWILQLGTGIWNLVEQWILSMRNQTWFTVEQWLTKLTISSWHLIEQWMLQLGTGFWNTIETWTLVIRNPYWNFIETWLLKIGMPPQPPLWFQDPKTFLIVATVIFMGCFLFYEFTKWRW